MKRTSSSPATCIVAGSDTHSDKKQRTTQENGPTTTAIPPVAERTTAETLSAAAAASDETTGKATPAASDGASYVSDSLQVDLDDDISISDLLQWPPEDDKQSLPNQNQQSYLCSRCREIDFDEILSRNGAKKGGDPIMSFSDEQRVIRDPECAFCQAIQFIYPSLGMSGPQRKRPSLLIAASVDDHYGGVHLGRLSRRIILTFSQRDVISRWTRRRLDYEVHDRGYDAVGYLAEQQTIDSDCWALPADSVKPHTDLDLIKRKLDECRFSHSRCRNKRREDGRGVPGMRLIDCETRTVVPAPKRRCTYAALSYVWGISKSTSEPRPVSNNCHEELPMDLPHTIADAMLVALRLKIQYLWCDRYCIRQNPRNKEEADEKHGQIARMCDIYYRASITIVAAAGDGPSHGLPGVISKRQHPRVRIGSRTLFATLADPKMLIDQSKWSKRGWTFQEGLLARRRLVFTDQQVYFQCGEVGFFEAYDKSGEMGIPLIPYDCITPPVYPYFSINEEDFPDIWARVHSYAGLTLGNEQDILNAFLGVLKYYEEVALPEIDVHARNITGLLIQRLPGNPRSWPAALSVALGWQCNHPGKRRDGFPSWSWVGWYCQGFNRNKHEHSYPSLPESGTRSLFISVEGTNNDLVEHSQLHKLLEARHDLSEAKVLHVTAPSLEARIVPLTEKFPSDPRYIDNTGERLAVRYIGYEHDAFINLSDVLLCDASVPLNGLRCFAIILDEDHPDITDDRLGNSGLYIDCDDFTLHHATTLIVVEKNGGFERIGVSHVYRVVLREIGSTVREFRLM